MCSIIHFPWMSFISQLLYYALFWESVSFEISIVYIVCVASHCFLYLKMSKA